MEPAQPTVSVIVHRSRVLDQHLAYVRVDDRDAGFRDLRTGELHCADDGYAPIVAQATAPLMLGRSRPSPTAELYRGQLASITGRLASA